MPSLPKSRIARRVRSAVGPAFAAGLLTAGKCPNAVPIVAFGARIVADHAVSADRIAGAGQDGAADQDTAQAPKAWPPSVPTGLNHQPSNQPLGRKRSARMG